MNLKEFENQQLLEMTARMVEEVRNFAKSAEPESVIGKDSEWANDGGADIRKKRFGMYKGDHVFFYAFDQCQRAFCPYETYEHFVVLKDKERAWQFIQGKRFLSDIESNDVGELLAFDVMSGYNARARPSGPYTATGITPFGKVLSRDLDPWIATDLVRALLQPINEFVRVNNIEIQRRRE